MRGDPDAVPYAERVSGAKVSGDPDLTRPPSPTTGTIRLVRAGVLGGLSLLLATGAHVVGGGSLPGAGVLFVAAVLLGLLAALVTARRCHFGVLAVLLGVQQLALHELFSLAGAARACLLGTSGTTSPAHAGHAVHAGLEQTASACAAADGMQMTTSVPGWVMWAAHLGAVLVTAWLLARGEAWLWRVVARVAAAAGLAVGPPVPAALRASARTSHVDAVCRRLAYAAAAPRGPPLALAG